eukprot:23395_5
MKWAVAAPSQTQAGFPASGFKTVASESWRPVKITLRKQNVLIKVAYRQQRGSRFAQGKRMERSYILAFGRVVPSPFSLCSTGVRPERHGGKAGN